MLVFYFIAYNFKYVMLVFYFIAYNFKYVAIHILHKSNRHMNHFCYKNKIFHKRVVILLMSLTIL